MADALCDLFNSFCTFGGGHAGEMDNAKFAKFAKDTKIIDKKFTTTDIDLIFSKIKPKGERKISYDVFRKQGMAEIAAKKGVTPEELISSIIGAGGPQSSGTQAEAVRFHDDKESYTGVYAKGGPTNVDNATSDLSRITNRGDADVRGVAVAHTTTAVKRVDAPHTTTTTTTALAKPAPAEKRPSVVVGPSDLASVFDSFCTFGGGHAGEMDNAKFAKFAKDTKIIDKKFTTTDIDLIFSKIKPKGERKISYDVFRTQGLSEIAGKKGITVEELTALILGNGGPQSSGTQAEAVRFHDDKESYTGVYAKGGPTNVDNATSDLSRITNRGEADVRGVAKH